MALRDRIQPGVRVLFVGINPGIRSDLTGHHFAGYSNRFWKLLVDARIVPEPIDWRHDDRLPEWGLGITNLIPRATPGIGTLRRGEHVEGTAALRAKVRRFKPDIVAFVGVSLYRWIFGASGPVALGPQRVRFEDADVFVLPNPSGRNANYSYAEMLTAFRKLRRRLDVLEARHACAADDRARARARRQRGGADRRAHGLRDGGGQKRSAGAEPLGRRIHRPGRRRRP